MKKWLKVSLYSLGSLVGVILIGQINSTDDYIKTTLLEKQQKAVVSKNAEPNTQRDLVINTFRWQKSEQDSTGYHWFTVHNTSKRHSYTTIPVRFSYYSDAGEEVGYVDKVIDKAIKIGETVQVDKIETALPDQHTDGADMEITK
ncbi:MULTISPECIES: hypothetical protein [Spirosoma]|uniref:Uncharacterized protein n=1 Tax=Spirosoma liriopis TaxID=2937440 RepID=A0ABT0HVK3_9BACT|nr:MULTISPECIES: hypothetical protein [Spirosoma]MCK8495623.1 hypothetical protein [Spirosoma liriopis]UHG94502.1 hypothetical protein LQ777_28350 [Spirosoma oryzicola]